MELAQDGCNWIIGTSTKGVGATATTHQVFCNKIRQEGSRYCPKHVLFEEDRLQEPSRRFRARIASIKYQRERLEALARSPLKAHNPKFDEQPKEHGGLDAKEK